MNENIIEALVEAMRNMVEFERILLKCADKSKLSSEDLGLLFEAACEATGWARDAEREYSKINEGKLLDFKVIP